MAEEEKSPTQRPHTTEWPVRLCAFLVVWLIVLIGRWVLCLMMHWTTTMDSTHRRLHLRGDASSPVAAEGAFPLASLLVPWAALAVVVALVAERTRRRNASQQSSTLARLAVNRRGDPNSSASLVTRSRAAAACALRAAAAAMEEGETPQQQGEAIADICAVTGALQTIHEVRGVVLT